MDNRADTLRRRIGLYRTYLVEGVSAELAEIFLREIVEAEAELQRIGADCRAGDDGEPFGLEYWRS